MEFFDTHCHVHEASGVYTVASSSRERWLGAGITDGDVLVGEARAAGVTRQICVGTTLEDSLQAIAFADRHEGVWASVGIHPHDAKDYAGQEYLLDSFAGLASRPKVVAVGECGLDYYYNNSPVSAQREILEFQLEVARKYDLAVIFHVRDAFDDLWPIVDNFSGIRGVIHSFTSTTGVLEKVLTRGLYVGFNGIMTFTKHQEQLAAAVAAPLEKIVVETDAPYLTPAPQRGKICKSSHVVVTAEFLANLRGERLEQFAEATTRNANNLFRL